MEAKVVNNKIIVSFRYDPNLVGEIRKLPGRRYNPATRTWLVPDNDYTRSQLRKLGFDIPERTYSFPDLPDYLRDFQKEGVKFLFKTNGRALIADEMGLGKTVQAITFVNLKKLFPTIVVCPASLKWNWYEEIKKWTGLEAVVISGGKIHKLEEAKFYIINYDIFIKWLTVLASLKPQALIIDEAHYIKNHKAKRTKAIVAMAKRVPHVIALTGTPVINKPIEMYNAIKIISPQLFPSRWKFAERYCALHHDGYGWNMDGSSNEEELHKILTSTIMIRRTKEEVLKELPPKVKTVLPVDFVNAKYTQTIQKIKRLMRFDEDGKPRVSQDILAEIAYARQLIGESKVDAVVEWVENFLDENPSKKIVVFGWHRSVLSKIYEKFKNQAVVITGETKEIERQMAVKQFQTNPKIRVFVGSIRAAGVGITLTAADTVVFAELGWTPSEHDQAEDRIHRIGQKSVANIYYIVARGTIDEMLMNIIDRKRKVIDKIIDGKETSSDIILKELLTEIVRGK